LQLAPVISHLHLQELEDQRVSLCFYHQNLPPLHSVKGNGEEEEIREKDGSMKDKEEEVKLKKHRNPRKSQISSRKQS
jgi:hypothetical protein